jgi:hypothetical protein
LPSKVEQSTVKASISCFEKAISIGYIVSEFRAMSNCKTLTAACKANNDSLLSA